MHKLGDRIEMVRAMAHPVRISIIQELAKGVKCVSDFEEFLEISQPNVSQHLSLLRRVGVVGFYMQGRMRCYFLKDPMALELVEMLNKEFTEELPRPACCPVSQK